MARTLGKYRLIRELGRGGFGAVYLAEDPDLGIEVAVKAFSPDGALPSGAVQSFRDRFLEEARILRRPELARSPFVVDVYDLSTADAYYVMPLLPSTLRAEIGKDAVDVHVLAALPANQRPRPLPFARSMSLARQIAEALSEVHGIGVVHRDLKPGNILLTDVGDVCLADFGLAKLGDSEASVSGTTMGSEYYAAPEQRGGAKHVTPAADVFAFGAILYRLLTGTVPIGAFRLASSFAPETPNAIDELIMQCMAQSASSRPADGQALLAALQESTSATSSPRSGLASAAGPSSRTQGPDSRSPTLNSSGAQESSRTSFEGVIPDVRSELQPLLRRIEEALLKGDGITPEVRSELGVRASVFDLSEQDLDELISQVKESVGGRLRAINALATQIQELGERGALSASLISAIGETAESLGLEPSWVEDRLSPFAVVGNAVDAEGRIEEDPPPFRGSDADPANPPRVETGVLANSGTILAAFAVSLTLVFLMILLMG